jgi:hypothetical protein
MDKPISVGDLVMVLRSCDCKPERGYGTIFTVEAIEAAYRFECIRCDRIIRDGRPLAFGRISKGPGYHPVAWLRRIPPLEELEGEKTQEKIKEPA